MDAKIEHVSRWLASHYDLSATPEENWKRGEKAWDALTPQHQWFLWSLSVQEQRQIEDVRTILLQTLSQTKASEKIKGVFERALSHLHSK
jgi:hypothetical protein